MPNNPDTDPRPLPTMIPQPEYDRIRAGDKQALEDTLRSIINAVNQFIVRKGG